MSTIDSVTYQSGKPVTQSDTIDDPKGPFAGFYTGTGGTIRVLSIEGDDVTFQSAAAGVVITMAIKRVFTSTTTASGILGMVSRPYKGGP